MIVIPDIHGRTFWKEAVKGRENEKIIFLGDYLDPYEYEKISPEDAIKNFEEILNFANNHKDNVQLLLGNHDFMVYLSGFMGSCRSDFINKNKIHKLFIDNLNLFSIAKTDIIGDNLYVFSHAPILPQWVEDNMIEPIIGEALFSEKFHKGSDKIEEIVFTLNEALIYRFKDLCRALNCVSFNRGGRNDYGSCIWADVSEVSPFASLWDGYHCIFGHSQQEENPVLNLNWSCLDCRRAFEITEDGEIKSITPASNIYDIFEKK